MRLSQITDQELIRQYIDGKDASFEVLMKRHQDAVFTKIYMMVRDNDIAQDVFQDCFIKVINTLRSGRYNEEGKFLPWVMRIAHNLVIDHFRKSKKMPAVRSDDNYDVFATIGNGDKHREEEIIQEQILNDVKSLIKDLPMEQKEVVMMRHYYDMSFKEISEKLGISINTALGRMRYALINMRKIAEKKHMNFTLS